MELIPITDKRIWNDFVRANAPGNFLQSWEWGEIQAAAGKDIFRLGLVASGELLAGALLVGSPLAGGFKYCYSPRGPILAGQRFGQPLVKAIDFAKALVTWASTQGFSFWRLEPETEISLPTGSKKTISYQPEQTLMVDLAAGEDSLLAAMHQKTRYNIRLAEKKGVKIVFDAVAGHKDFVDLMAVTTARDGFRGHARAYYESLIKSDPEHIKLILAEYQGRIIAGGIFSFWGDTATYMHGASADEYRNVMAPYLLQWQAILFAKKLGYKKYDFYGISEAKWPGVTRFKLGFGGERVTYPGTFDYPFNRLVYVIYNLLRSWRRHL